VGSPLRALVRLVGYFAWTFALIPIQVACLALRLPLSKRLPRYYHRVCCRILGLAITIKGERSLDHPVLFAANHTGYLDISVLGAAIEGCFVAKAEVAGWPLFGLLAKLQRTVFVERRRGAAKGQADGITRRLEAGDDLIFFPEGTSTDGNRVLPFKSSLFSVAETKVRERAVRVQPVSVAFTRLDGVPLGRNLRSYYTWYGDMDMASHLWGVVSLGTVTVEVRFHPPTTLDAHGSRKALARHCETRVAQGLAAALSGREGALVATA
jgi:1-acyl-sn-glycerol-3-phosphate acyltransferase